MKLNKRILSLALAAVMMLGIFAVAPFSAFAAGNDFAIFGGSGGGGNHGNSAHIAFGGAPGTGTLGGAGAQNMIDYGGGGGGQASVIDGAFIAGGAAGSGATGGGSGDTKGGDGEAQKPGGDGGSNGGGGAGGGSGASIGRIGKAGGNANTYRYTMLAASYDSVSVEGGNGGAGNYGGTVNTAYGGGGGAGAHVAVTSNQSLTVAGSLSVLGGAGGAGGDPGTGGTGGEEGNSTDGSDPSGAGGGGGAGNAAITVSGAVTAQSVSLVGGMNGADGTYATPSGTSGGTGGKGGEAALTADSLEAASITVTANDGGASLSIGTLYVNENTTITVDGTAAADVVITNVTIATGKTLTINRVNGGDLTITNWANPTLSDATLPGGTVGVNYSHSLTAYASGIASLSFALEAASSLPAGLTLETDGTISGTPTAAVSNHSFRVKLTDSKGNTATATFTLTVAPPQPSGDSVPTYTQRTLTDKDTGVTVTGQMTSYARLTVRERVLHAEGSCPACDEIRARMAAGELIILYDISVSGGNTGELEVSIPVVEQYNGQTVTILHCANGKLESVTCVVQNGVAKGIFKKLSPFAVVRGVNVGVPENVVADPPKTGSAMPLGWMLMALAALLMYNVRFTIYNLGKRNL